eukprot:scaffold87969_cov86-Attheya_sp.AAC.1
MAGYLTCLSERTRVRLVVDVPSASPGTTTTTSSTLLLAVSGAVVHHVHLHHTTHFVPGARSNHVGVVMLVAKECLLHYLSSKDNPHEIQAC